MVNSEKTAKEDNFTFPVRCVYYLTNLFFLLSMFFFESYIDSQSSTPRIALQTKTCLYRGLNRLRHFCARVRICKVFHVGSIYDTLLEDDMTSLPCTILLHPSFQWRDTFSTMWISAQFLTQDILFMCQFLLLVMQLPVFQKFCTIRMPPLTSLPYSDKLCFDCLFTSLSPKNIVKVFSAFLQEKRVLFVSEQMDSLTLCAQAFNDLLYPLRWIHPFVPILPLAVTETVSVEMHRWIHCRPHFPIFLA